MSHIIERFIDHLAAGPFLTLVVFFAVRFWQAKKEWPRLRLPIGKGRLLFFAAVLVALVVPIRELWDLWRGNNGLGKAVADTFSWWIAGAVGYFGLYRFWRAKE